MIKKDFMNQNFDTYYSYLFEEDLLNEIKEKGVFKKFSADTNIIEIGDYIKSMPLLMDELLEAIDTIAFLKMDDRLFKYLKDKAMVTNNDVITTTHKKISDDLHTSRVVVSRILKKLENEKKIKLFRNSIQVLEL